MSLHIGDQAPNFSAQTTEGPIDFHAWLGEAVSALRAAAALAKRVEQIATGSCKSYLIGCPDTCVGARIDPELSRIGR